MAPSRQAGDARAHDEDLRRRHRAGRGHHHRQCAAVFGGGIDDCAVAREIGLAREHVHDLRAGDARHQLHRESGDAGLRHAPERGILAVGIHDGDDQRASLVAGELGRRGAAHLEHDVGVFDRAVRDRGAGGDKIGVGNAGLGSRARLDHDVGPERPHLLDCFRGRGNAMLARIGLTRYRNAHSLASS
jgi:hypothetical protein